MKFNLTRLPKKPYVNFGDYLDKETRRPVTGQLLSCSECRGSGETHRWEDRDPIEGWKMAPLYTCHECGGSGVWSMDRHRDVYRRKYTAWKQACAAASERIEKEREVIKKIRGLGEDDLEILKSILR